MFDAFNVHYVVLLVLSLLIAIPVHESVHALVARWLGDTTADEEGRITLNPFKHVDIVFTILVPAVMVMLGLPPIFAAKPVPFNPHNVRFGDIGAAMVAIAGPVSNLLLAVVGALILRSMDITHLVGIGQFLFVFIVVNISLFVFNMIPIPPLDGSRLIYAFAPDSVRRVMDIMESYGLLLIIGLLLVLIQFIGPVLSNITDAILNFLLR